MGLPMKGKLIRSNCVLVCLRFRIHGYVAAPSKHFTLSRRDREDKKENLVTDINT
jgi:hypothetical protein